MLKSVQKSMQKSVHFLVRFFNAFWYHFGSILGSNMGPKIYKKSMNFRIDFCIEFFMDFVRSRPPFWLHFGSQNRPRRRSGAKRPTLDFEQPSNENHGFSSWRVPARTQNHHQKPSQNSMRFYIDFRIKNCSKNAPKMELKCV